MTIKLVIDRKVTCSPLPGYRPNAAAVIVNTAGQTLMARRNGAVRNFWQYPQGGIEVAEAPLAACMRELHEETGFIPHRLQFMGAAPCWLSYDIPAARRAPWANIGQVQAWFLLCLTPGYHPDLAAVLRGAGHQEFDRLMWGSPQQALCNIVDFKATVYRKALGYFASAVMRNNPLWAHLPSGLL